MIPRFALPLAFVASIGLLAPGAFASSKNKKDDVDEIGNRDVGGGVNFYSIQKEIALGKQLAQEVERQSKVIDDPVIAEYVNRIGQNLVRNSDAKVPFTIKVLDTEAELAGVMAHEIAHVALRHGTKQATRAEMAQIGMIAASIAVPYGLAGYGALQGANLLVPVAFLKFSRSMERQADFFGLQYMYKTGYDPTAFVDFFEKIETMEKKKPGTVSKLFATHPMTDDRITASQEEIQKVLPARPEYVVNTSEFNDVKARLAMLHNHRKVESEDPNRPRLRRAPGSGTGTATGTDNGQTDSDDRPTLKRRPDGQ